MRYRAFISCRRQDASAAARWLRGKLPGFRPAAGKESEAGSKRIVVVLAPGRVLHFVCELRPSLRSGWQS